jgi:hypothetical protein
MLGNENTQISDNVFQLLERSPLSLAVCAKLAADGVLPVRELYYDEIRLSDLLRTSKDIDVMMKVQDKILAFMFYHGMVG